MIKICRYFAIGFILLILAAGCASHSTKNKLFETFKSKGFNVQETDNIVLIYLPEVYFEFGSAILTQSAHDSLLIICNVINNLGNDYLNIHVDGHTDSIGNEKYNKKLSLQRANAAAEILASNGINKDRIIVQGHGKKQPIAPNTLRGNLDNPDGRAKNRRVEIGVVFNK